MGRVRIYNLGFVIYTSASLALTIDWMTGAPGAIWLMVFRVVQGIGAAYLIADISPGRVRIAPKLTSTGRPALRYPAVTDDISDRPSCFVFER